MARVFTSPPSRLTWEDLQAFLDQGLPEGERIDYKALLNDRVPESIAAMANTQGGVILVGVAEEPTTKKPILPPEGIAVEHIGGGTLANLCYARMSPPFVPAYHFVPFPENPKRGVLVVQVIPEAAPIPIWVVGKGVLTRIDDQNRPADLHRLRSLLEIGDNRLKPLLEAADHQIRLALQANAEDRTYAIVGATIRRSVPQTEWSSAERLTLARGIRRVVRFPQSPDFEVKHSAETILIEIEKPFTQISLSAHGIAVIIAGWRADPFQVVCAVAAWLAGVKILQQPEVTEVFQPIDPIEVTLGLVNWPPRGLLAGQLLDRVADPQPIGVLAHRRTSRRYHLALNSPPWSVIGPFLGYVLAEAGYTRYERHLEEEPLPWFLAEMAEGCGIALREWEDE